MKTLEHIDGDIFKIGGIQVVAHQCNCQNTFGSGIARTIREKFPEAYEADCQATKEGVNKLGNISFAEVRQRDYTDIRFIFNLYGQNLGTDYNKLYDRKTDYEALFTALQKMNNLCARTADNLTVAFPWKMGADRAKGDWRIVERLIEVAFDNYTGRVMIVHYVNG